MVRGVFSIPLGFALEEQTAPSRAGARSTATFIAGPENALIQQIAAALQGRAAVYSPLVVYGPTGLGKSLLMQLLPVEFQRQHPSAPITILTGADLGRAYANAVDTDSVAEFRGRITRSRLLALDDLHHLAGKPAAQQELVVVLDALQRRGGCVLATLRHAPLATKGLSPLLASRLSAGLIAPLAPPQPAARRLILQQLAHEQNVTLDDEVLAQLLSPRRRQLGAVTAPQLRQALMRLLEQARQTNRKVDTSLLADVQHDQAADPKAAFKKITTAVARHLQIPVADMRGQRRQQSLVQARGLAMFLCRNLTSASFAEIGGHFGGRDHTTVIHAVQKITQLMASDAQLRQTADELILQHVAEEPR